MSRSVAAMHAGGRLRWAAPPMYAMCSAGWAALGSTIAVSVYLSDRPQWWTLSICAFGIPEMSSRPWVFNYGVLIAGLLMALLAVTARPVLRSYTEQGVLTPVQYRLIIAAIAVLATQAVVVALVPYDLGSTAKLIHNIAGWGGGCVIGLCMVATALWLRIFDPRFNSLTWVSAAMVVALFAGYQFGLLPYALAEIMGLACGAAWSVTFFVALEAAAQA